MVSKTTILNQENSHKVQISGTHFFCNVFRSSLRAWHFCSNFGNRCNYLVERGRGEVNLSLFIGLEVTALRAYSAGGRGGSLWLPRFFSLMIEDDQILFLAISRMCGFRSSWRRNSFCAGVRISWRAWCCLTEIVIVSVEVELLEPTCVFAL